MIMNMQNKLYTAHFVSPPNDQYAAVPEQRSQTPQMLAKFMKILGKGQTHRKVGTHGQERIQTQGN